MFWLFDRSVDWTSDVWRVAKYQHARVTACDMRKERGLGCEWFILQHILIFIIAITTATETVLTFFSLALFT